MVWGVGFEPTYKAPKTSVLPLDEPQTDLVIKEQQARFYSAFCWGERRGLNSQPSQSQCATLTN
jgi:hypothetical protein